MNPNPLKQGVLTEKSCGIGTVTRGMVRNRAVELAAINGRTASEVSKSDWEDAKRELTGQQGDGLKESILEAAPELERWDPLPGSEGSKTMVVVGEDEDEEGRNDSQILTEEGIGNAEHDQMLRAAKEIPKV